MSRRTDQPETSNYVVVSDHVITLADGRPGIPGASVALTDAEAALFLDDGHIVPQPTTADVAEKTEK